MPVQRSTPARLLAILFSWFVISPAPAAEVFKFSLPQPVPCEVGEEFTVGVILTENTLGVNNVSLTVKYLPGEFEYVRTEGAPEFLNQSDATLGASGGSEFGEYGIAFSRDVMTFPDPLPIETGPIANVVFRTRRADIQNTRLIDVREGNITALRGGTIATNARFDITETEVITCGGGGELDPCLVYKADFSADNVFEWFPTVGDVGELDGTVSSTSAEGIGLNANGSSTCFGFWGSPTINVPPGTRMVVTWRIRTQGYENDDALLAPQVRPRINEVKFRQSQTLPVESTAFPSLSPPADGTPATYRMYWNQPPDSGQIFLAFDMLSVSPFDDTNATMELMDVEVRLLDCTE
ncbi:MAG: hypothetical protein RLY93_10450 [Sumerlaeia bacterium]